MNVEQVNVKLDRRCDAFLTDIRRVYYKEGDFEILIANYHLELFQNDFFSFTDIEMDADLRKSSITRKAEFLAGRLLTKIAQNRIGLAQEAVRRAPDRAPIWPRGSSGSISHSAGVCACLIQRHAKADAGLDVEQIASGDTLDALEHVALLPSERRLIGSTTGLFRAELVTLIFSAKESLFKALYPTAQYIFDFSHVECVKIDCKGFIKIMVVKDICSTIKRNEVFYIKYRSIAHHFVTWCRCFVPRNWCESTGSVAYYDENRLLVA